MSLDYQLTALRLSEGVWDGVLTGADHAPDLVVTLGGEELGAPEVLPHEDGFLVRVVIPATRISDGAQVFSIRLASDQRLLNSFAILAGDVVRDDMRAELALLRDELDLLKRAFRRHARASEHGM